MRAAFEVTGDFEAAARWAWALAEKIGTAAGMANEDGGAYGLLLVADTKGMKPVLAAFDDFLKAA